MPTLSFFAVAASSAVAAATPTLVTVVRGSGAGADKAAGFVSHYARYLLDEDGRYEVVDLAAALGGPEAEQARRVFAEVDGLLQKAVAAYEGLELDRARDHLMQALTRFEKNAAHVGDFKKVAQILTMLGAVHILRGEEKTGAERLAQAVAIDPSVEPEPRFFNPSMRQTFQKAAQQVQTRAKSRVSLSSTPSYAEVYVDGVFAGVTPTAIEQVTEGRHYVRLVRDGYRPYGAVVSAAGGREVVVNGTLRPQKSLGAFDGALTAALGALAQHARDDGDDVGDVNKLGELVKADQVFLAEVRLDGERVTIVAGQYDLVAQKRLKTATHVFAYDTRPETYEREVGVLLRTQFGETTLSKKVTANAPEAGVVVSPASERMRTMALIGGLGGGVLLGGIGGLLAVLAASDHTNFRAAPQASEEAASYESSGRTKALVGDVLMTLGVAAAAVGVGLYLYWEPQSSAEGGQVDVALVPLPAGAAMSARYRF